MYKEINPAAFTIVTFPFLFGVMFGDIGHGSMLLIAGILLCLFDGYIRKASTAISSIRYLVLLMGIFAFYIGWIYNEFFAIPLEVFGSCYEEEPRVLANIPNLKDPKTIFDPLAYGYRRLDGTNG